jgi:hypothetical protein
MCLHSKKRFLLLSLMLLHFSCVYHELAEPVDCAVSGPVLALDEVTPATSCSTADGAIRVAASGGEEPYTFFLNGVERTGEEFRNLLPGIYTVSLTDRNRCSQVLENVTVMALGFSFSASVQENTECAGGNGIVTINVEEGNPPYTYKLGDGAFTENNTFESLASGNHTILVKDADECTIALNVTVPRGFTGTSWINDIRPLMVNYCALEDCHDGDGKVSGPKDLRVYDNVKLYAAKVKSSTQDRSMPFDGVVTLTQAQIDLIGCWVDDGALNN